MADKGIAVAGRKWRDDDVAGDRGGPGGGAPRTMSILFSFLNGGSERLGGMVAIDLHERGWPVEVCATHSADGPIREWLEAAGVPAVGVDVNARSRLGRRWALFRLLRRRRIELLHVQHVPMLALCYWPARLAGVRRIVLTEHTDAQMRGNPRLARRGRHYARLADRVTVVHDGLRRYFVDELGVPAERVRTIPNGVDTARFMPAPADPAVRAELGAGPEELLFGTVARLHADKGHETLLHAFARACRARPDGGLRLALVGDGPERGRLEALAAELGLEAMVRFAGNREDVDRILPQFDAFVLPSNTEGAPLVLLEAMACGIPSIATAVGGIPDMLAAGGGRVVPPGEPEAMAQAITELAENAAERRRLGTSGRELATARHQFDDMIGAYRTTLCAAADIPGEAT